jgi:DnaJ-domain-containing protein 1
MNELRLLGAKNVILSTNIPLRNDGLPYARYKTPDDPGVAVYFQLKGQLQVFACDRWKRVEDNMQAIRKTIEAIRGLERWGSSEMLNRIFKGFEALPETAGESVGSWWAVLGVDPDWPLEQIEAAYKQAAKIHHPDRPGGSHEKMTELNRAIDEARKEKGR